MRTREAGLPLGIPEEVACRNDPSRRRIARAVDPRLHLATMVLDDARVLHRQRTPGPGAASNGEERRGARAARDHFGAAARDRICAIHVTGSAMFSPAPAWCAVVAMPTSWPRSLNTPPPLAEAAMGTEMSRTGPDGVGRSWFTLPSVAAISPFAFMPTTTTFSPAFASSLASLSGGVVKPG